MFRRTTFALLAALLLSASVNAQEPVFGLSPEEFPVDTAAPSEDPADALPPAFSMPTQDAAYAPAPSFAPADLASYSGGGITHGGYIDNHSYAHGGDYYGGCSSCGDCSGCCDCYGGCPPTIWRVRSSAVYMARETTDDTILVFQNGNPTDAVLNAANFQFDWETGFDISLMQGDGFGGEVELRALYLTDFDDRITGTGNGLVELNNQVFFLGLAAPPTAGFVELSDTRTAPVDVTADYHSEFRTVELNYREAFTPWWTCMVGFRYANLDDELTLRTLDAAALTSLHYYFADNDMFGFQAGTEMILASNPKGWDIITTLKGGIYYNRVDLHVSSQGPAIADGQLSFVTGETAWLGEATLQARRHLSCNGTLTFGYSIMSIDGISLATEQMTTVFNPLAGPNLQGSSNRSTIFYHGANAGIEIRW